jgi:hypothetical protein
MCIHMQTFHDTYQYYYMIAPVVLVCIGTCIWYVFVRIFAHFNKYTLIHTFTTSDLGAGSCVRTSRPNLKVPLGLLMYVSHGRQHQRMALGACACSGRPPTGTYILRRPITYWAGTRSHLNSTRWRSLTVGKVCSWLMFTFSQLHICELEGMYHDW